MWSHEYVSFLQEYTKDQGLLIVRLNKKIGEDAKEMERLQKTIDSYEHCLKKTLTYIGDKS